MFFPRASNTDIIQSTLNDVNRDQHVHICNRTEFLAEQINMIQVILSDPSRPGTDLLPLHNRSIHPPHPTCSASSSSSHCESQRITLIPTSLSPLESISRSTHLIIQLVDLLVGAQETNRNMVLKLELQRLCESLISTRDMIWKYEDKPLGPSLANAITPDLNRCLGVLGELLNTVNKTRQALNPTSIKDLWRRVWWVR